MTRNLINMEVNNDLLTEILEELDLSHDLCTIQIGYDKIRDEHYLYGIYYADSNVDHKSVKGYYSIMDYLEYIIDRLGLEVACNLRPATPPPSKGGIAMDIINLTPHTINLVVGKTEIKIMPEGIIARVSVEKENIGHLKFFNNPIPINKNVYGEVEGLPAPKEGTVYIVSSLVAAALPHRKDLYVPDDLIRDDEGRIVGCRALAQI